MLKNKNVFSWLNFFKKKSLDCNIDHSKSLNTNNKCISDDCISDMKYKKNNFFFKIKKFFLKNTINDTFFKKLEEQLLKFDCGVEVSNKIIRSIFEKYKNNEFNHEKDIYHALKKNLFKILNKSNLGDQGSYPSIKDSPYIILLIGVNGVGKTTVAAKLALFYKNLGKSVALVASDTFRAAAIEQIKYWGNKISVPVFFKKYGTDPSSVIFDAIEFAYLKKVDILIIDTAGRLHNKINLIKELQKNVRVIQKKINFAPNEILLVLDARNGQNSLVQAELFLKNIQKITGIVLTKLDGTAKGGIIFSISEKCLIPILYFSNGEKLSNFYSFNAIDFIENMFL